MFLPQTLPASPLELGLAAVVLCFGAYLNGSLGFGMGMIAAPILMLINPVFVPVTVLILGLFVTVSGLWRDRHSLALGPVAWALAGRLPGSIAGAMVVVLVAKEVMGLLVGLSVVGGVVMGALGRFPERRPLTMFNAGFASGIMATVSAAGGAPIVLAYQSAPPPIRRAALAVFFSVGTLMSLVALVSVGAIGRGELLVTAILFPPVLAGFLLGVAGPVIRQERRVRQALLAICLISGLAVVGQSGLALLRARGF